MDVVRHASGRDWDKIQIKADSGELLPEPFLNVGNNKLLPSFRAEYNVEMILREGMCHSFRPSRGSTY